MKVSALYLLPRSIYSTLAEVDCWDEKRDARRYCGPHPVVAHPPCGPWSKLAWRCLPSTVAKYRHLAPCAVLQVRKWGGVLEHPAGSRLWAAMSLPRAVPVTPLFGVHAPPVDAWGGFAVEVDQYRWGHAARKLTWLYFVGVKTGDLRFPPAASTAPQWVGIRACGRHRTRYDMFNPRQRSETPPSLASWLVEVASQTTWR